MIRARINIMPSDYDSDTVLLKLLEEERAILNPRIEPKTINYFRQFVLRNKTDQELHSNPLKSKTPASKVKRAAANQWTKATDKTEEDGVEPVVFGALSFKEGHTLLMESSQFSRVKDAVTTSQRSRR
jgi:hypothetical protein